MNTRLSPENESNDLGERGRPEEGSPLFSPVYGWMTKSTSLPGGFACRCEGAHTVSSLRRRKVVESHQIDILAFAVPGDFQQVKHSEKAGLAGEFGGDVGKSNLRNRV